ncbi:SPFH domain-containing protein [Mycoplasmopsis gallopavonis]|uniref:Membrane protease subunits, stomatin/prohibitin-like protein n=1 Tax=Mycoplasmopsis gallopavonis TaxID=76629 RepID=A0A449AYE4_9BACT|nr:SPFH domain-containing protein [Mycoplasmopsis gallopavonis]RIV16165.1 peptidase [Mycoplasmopsis gallopavonis]VEU72543.1 membrane protease subunits, stomatin/prohibitin-like protein [Mycoplasmopsis gallopavonis]
MSAGQIIGLVVLAIIILLILFILIPCIKIVSEKDFIIIQRFGKYHATLTKGIHFIVPFIDRVLIKDSTKEKFYDFQPQLVITKDNATIKVDTVTYLKIIDPKLYAYGAEKPVNAVENLTATTLRNLIGEMDLDDSLTSREIINAKLTEIIDKVSDPWGIKITRIEIKNIMPPREIQEAMVRQMQAERDKRALILEAEGIKQSEILKAEGRRQSTILNAEAEKSRTLLAAEAEKQKLILEAEGQREAINIINEAKLNKEVLTLKAIEKLTDLSNGNATKLIIPANVSDFAGQIASATEIFKTVNSKDNKNSSN